MDAATPLAFERLYVLDLSGGRILSLAPDGSDLTVLAQDCRLPDGIAVDAQAGHLYWTNMGVPTLDDGSIERIDLDGGNRRTVVAPGVTFTPKQLQIDTKQGRLYWSDREGMRVMRARLDGSAVETLIQTGSGDADRANLLNWCVGVAVDPADGHLYWSQKGDDDGGHGRIFRAALELPAGARPDRRDDIELLFGGLPEPIDLELDLDGRSLYWTDRGDPPRGNTVNRAPLDAPANGPRPPPEILATHLMEGIGIALDLDGGRMFMTDLGGSIYSAKLDGSERKTLRFAQGNLSGIAYVRLPR